MISLERRRIIARIFGLHKPRFSCCMAFYRSWNFWAWFARLWKWLG